jgi:hypothetical protein
MRHQAPLASRKLFISARTRHVGLRLAPQLFTIRAARWPGANEHRHLRRPAGSRSGARSSAICTNRASPPRVCRPHARDCAVDTAGSLTSGLCCRSVTVRRPVRIGRASGGALLRSPAPSCVSCLHPRGGRFRGHQHRRKRRGMPHRTPASACTRTSRRRLSRLSTRPRSPTPPSTPPSSQLTYKSRYGTRSEAADSHPARASQDCKVIMPAPAARTPPPPKQRIQEPPNATPDRPCSLGGAMGRKDGEARPSGRSTCHFGRHG